MDCKPDTKLLYWGMLRCRVCQQEKEDFAFQLRSKRENRRQHICKECQKTVSRRNYLKHRKKRIRQARVRTLVNMERVRQGVWDYLLQHPCVDCQKSNPLILEFDHVRGEKALSISNAISNARWSWKKVKEEISKCEVRCRNCHQLKTHRERNSWKFRKT